MEKIHILSYDYMSLARHLPNVRKNIIVQLHHGQAQKYELVYY